MSNVTNTPSSIYQWQIDEKCLMGTWFKNILCKTFPAAACELSTLTTATGAMQSERWWHSVKAMKEGVC